MASVELEVALLSPRLDFLRRRFEPSGLPGGKGSSRWGLYTVLSRVFAGTPAGQFRPQIFPSLASREGERAFGAERRFSGPILFGAALAFMEAGLSRSSSFLNRGGKSSSSGISDGPILLVSVRFDA